MEKKRIVCYGDSNTYGAEPGGGRYGDDVRWTMRLARLLGSDYDVISEGLCGRTTVHDDPLCDGLNGMKALYPVLMSHGPIDLVILMLGTNDCKSRFGVTGHNIAEGIRALIQRAKALPIWRTTPNFLVLIPIKIDPRIVENADVYGHMGPGCVEKSIEAVPWIRSFAETEGCAVFDINDVVESNTVDWMHIAESSQLPLAERLRDEVLKILK